MRAGCFIRLMGPKIVRHMQAHRCHQINCFNVLRAVTGRWEVAKVASLGKGDGDVDMGHVLSQGSLGNEVRLSFFFFVYFAQLKGGKRWGSQGSRRKVGKVEVTLCGWKRGIEFWIEKKKLLAAEKEERRD